MQKPPKAVSEPAKTGVECHSASARITAFVQYTILSSSITFFNRAVFSKYHFDFPSLLTLLQLSISIVYLYLLNWASFLKLEKPSIAAAVKVAPLTFFWWLYVMSGVTALEYLNIPIFSALRRTTTVLIVIAEFYVFKRRLTRQSMASMLLLVGGPVVAGLTDITFSLPGYVWVLVCNISTAAYVTLIRKLNHSAGFCQATLLLYNSLLALPLTVAHLLIATTELQGVQSYPGLWETRFQAFLFMSCSQAFLLNLCHFRCTVMGSPLAMCIAGQMKEILTTGLGIVLFQDFRHNTQYIAGIALGLLGSIFYATTSYRERTMQNN